MMAARPSRRLMSQKISASEVLDLYWDGHLPVNPERVADKMGIEVNPGFGLDHGASGMIEVLPSGRTVISFDVTEAPVRQRFTIAHEIGHFACGHLAQGRVRFRDTSANFRTYQVDSVETEANRFAADFLMPADLVRYAVIDKGVTDIGRLANIFFVSQAAMGFRLKNLGLA